MVAGMMAVVAAGQAAAVLRKAVESANEVWGAYAAARGLAFRAGRVGWALTEWPRIEAAIDGISVALELAATATAECHTLALATPLAPVRGHLEATPERWVSHLAKLLGAEDRQTGDTAFDTAYVVKATRDELVRLLLDEAVRGEALALRSSRIAYDDGSDHGHAPIVVVAFPGALALPRSIERALHLVATLARVRSDEGPYR
ncbi:MAG TPA: hypothetical protein VGM06_06315 [Polyangiaceae bacterium]|jgi:hypothetical protein